MAHSAPDIVYGATIVARLSAEEYHDTFNLLKKHKVKTLDTAFSYARYSSIDHCNNGQLLTSYVAWKRDNPEPEWGPKSILDPYKSARIAAWFLGKTKCSRWYGEESEGTPG